MKKNVRTKLLAIGLSMSLLLPCAMPAVYAEESSPVQEESTSPKENTPAENTPAPDQTPDSAPKESTPAENTPAPDQTPDSAPKEGTPAPEQTTQGSQEENTTNPEQTPADARNRASCTRPEGIPLRLLGGIQISCRRSFHGARRSCFPGSLGEDYLLGF